MNKKESKYFNTASFFDEALLELLENKDYEYITIKEICDKAGYNRSTFYLHYESIDDLLDESINYMMSKFYNKFEIKHNILSIESNDNLIFINDEYLNPYLDFIKENKIIFKLSYKHPKVLKVDDTYHNLKINILNPILEKYNVDKNKRKYIIDFYVNGIMAIIKEWVDNDCMEDKSFIIEVIKECVRIWQK